MIFEEAGYLPKEVMLELTLKAFGFEIDMLEASVSSLFDLNCTLIIFVTKFKQKKKKKIPL